MRKNRVMVNRMRKHIVLVAEGKGQTQEAYALQSQIGACGVEAIREQEAVVETMRAEIQSERTKRWRAWAATSWDAETTYIYSWIRERRDRDS
eukprot:2852166-Heterocapsa_arctica.AAC.1